MGLLNTIIVEKQKRKKEIDKNKMKNLLFNVNINFNIIINYLYIINYHFY